MTVFMCSSAQKGGKWHETAREKSSFGEALFLTTSHLVVLVTINVCSKHPLFYASPFDPGSTTVLEDPLQGSFSFILLAFIIGVCSL